ncbi:RHS repeat domain-containing protein [Priestia flexa]|uniref:RHS repeat domain-containing protein n=1 Tax=Priestia flexa TaxID=86664 RepID=UPI003CD0DA59
MGSIIKYDQNGNRLEDGKYTYTWNAADQLTSITKKGESKAFATYKYDDDRRIEKNVNGTVTRFYYDGDSINPLYETDGNGNVLRSYVYSMDGVRLSMQTGGKSYYYHYNPHGDVVAMTNDSGNVVVNYTYDAWGNAKKQVVSGQTDIKNPFTYAGYMQDDETGMSCLIARYYNPEQGVFISADPDPGDVDDPITQNGYTYVNNNPVMYVDPDGHLLWFAVNAGFAAYDGYKAYKAGKNKKQIAWAVASNFIKVGKIARVSYKLGQRVTHRGALRAAKRAAGIPNNVHIKRKTMIYDGTSEHRTVYDFGKGYKKIVKHKHDKSGRGPHFYVVDGVNPYKKGRYDQRRSHYPENRSGYKKRGKKNR